MTKNPARSLISRRKRENCQLRGLQMIALALIQTNKVCH